MTMPFDEQLKDSRVAVAKLRPAAYPEIPDAGKQMLKALEYVADQLEWSDERRGVFGKIIPAGARVAVKPNLVIHKNYGPWGIEPLLTHTSLIAQVVESVLQAEPSEVYVGDAPIQECEFDRLLNITGLATWSDYLMSRELRYKGIRDFRRTTCRFVNGMRKATEDLTSASRFVLFDLKDNSLLEPITDDRGSFRVTCYDPKFMAKTHAPGRHQYLIAKDVLEADVVINLPKLKTHKKAGITCALKNLVGINGNKEYLPHHRVGGSQSGGDCYPGDSFIKKNLEHILDRYNSTKSFAVSQLLYGLKAMHIMMLRLAGDSLGVEGSWSGNDTVWRMCLDLNRILLYGRSDGTIANEPQRQIIHIVDAIVAGQGDGPLAPQPLRLGLILAGRNAPAIDTVGAKLLGYKPERIPIVSKAFGETRWPLSGFSPADVFLTGDLGIGRADKVMTSEESTNSVIHPVGWLDAATEDFELKREKRKHYHVGA